jgi:hypothetical protein
MQVHKNDLRWSFLGERYGPVVNTMARLPCVHQETSIAPHSHSRSKVTALRISCCTRWVWWVSTTRTRFLVTLVVLVALSKVDSSLTADRCHGTLSVALAS